MQASTNLLVGRYEVGECIGRGDRCSVHAGRVASLDVQVAIKFLDPQLAARADACERFFSGARVAARLTSPRVVPVIDVGTAENGLPFIVMERIDGEPLRARVLRVGAMSVVDLIALVRDVAGALDALHACGLLHNDVKPDDVFIAPRDGRESAFLTGLSFASPPPDPSLPPALGTPYFVAPERLQAGLGADARADLWSLGASVYFAVTGVLPFEAASMPELFAAILDGPMPVPSRAAPHLSRAFDAWFARACDRDRRGRFGTASELADALAGVLRHETSGFGTPSRAPGGRTPCATCGEPIRVPPMVFCPNCGVRLTSAPIAASRVPTNTAPLGPPSFMEFGGLHPETAQSLGQFRPDDTEPPDEPMPMSRPTMALAMDPYAAAAAAAPTGPGPDGAHAGAPEAVPARPPSQPTLALADAMGSLAAAARRSEPPSPPDVPPPSQPTLALSHVDAYAPPPPAPPPSQPTLAVEVPEIPAVALRAQPMPSMQRALPPQETTAPSPPMPARPSASSAPRRVSRPPPIPLQDEPPPPAPLPMGPAAVREPNVVAPPAAEARAAFDAPFDAPGAAGPASSDGPAAWLFRARLGQWKRAEVLAAGFASTGVNAVAVTASKVVLTRGGGWEELELDAKIDLTRVRAIRGVGPDAFFLLGAGGLVLRVNLEGGCEFWGVELDPAAPIAAAELTFYDALPDGDGALFVGERPGATGPVGILARGAPRWVRVVVPGTPAVRLRSMARIAGGSVVACGAGKLVAFERDVVAGTVEIAPGELHRIVANEGGALVVGDGAYAFNVGPKLHAQLEEVQTTSDLVSLTSYEGVGWAGSARGARILRRSAQGVWTRLTGNLGTDAGVIALAATEREVRAVLDDGTLVTGTLGM